MTITINNPSNKLRVARAFCKELRAYLTPSLIGKVVARNKREENKSICHSHDFCDANQIMLNAFQRCRLINPASERAQNESDANSLWNDAWTIARKAEFNADKCAVVALPLWVSEFGLEWKAPTCITTNPNVKDESWHNDICPTFSCGDKVLWVDHPIKGNRELGGKRFTVTLRESSGRADDKESTLLETDSLDEAMAQFLS